MGNTLDELKRQQAAALRELDLSALSAINQKIFAMREKIRRKKELERQKMLDERTAKKIEKILEKGE